jgi:4-carboxymuconolactone decarboxylase
MTIPASNPDNYAFIPKIAELRDSMLFGDIWERPELSKRDRSLITCAVLTALYRTEEMKGHFQRAIANGVTKEELSEMITHVTFYAGWPNGVNASRVAMEVLS